MGKNFNLFIGVFLFALGAFLILGSGRAKVVDEYMIYSQADSFLNEGHFSVNQAEKSPYWYGKKGVDGNIYAPYGIFHAFLLTPFLSVNPVFFVASIAEPGAFQAAQSFPGSLFSSICLAFFIAGIIFLAFKKGWRFFDLILLLLIFIFSTFSTVYAGTYFSEPLVMCFYLLTVFLFKGILENPNSMKGWALFLLGVLLGTLIWIRPIHAISIPIFGLCWFLSEHSQTVKLKNAFYAFLPVGFLIVLHLFYNHHLYGHFFDFGYPPEVNGVKVNGFTNSFFLGVFAFLFSPGKSIFLYAPILFLGILGLKRSYQKNKPLSLLYVSICLLYISFYSFYANYEGGYSYGPRYLLVLLPFIFLAALDGNFHEKPVFLRKSLIVVFILGLLVNLPGILTSFVEAQAVGDYYDSGFKYQIGYLGFIDQWHYVIHYLGMSSGRDISLGLGWDMGWFFLKQAELSITFIGSLFVVSLCFLGLGAYLIYYTLLEDS